MMKRAETVSKGLDKFRTILGVRFFTGTAGESLDKVRSGGLLVVPAAPALKDLPSNLGYREALLGSDVAITDSFFMVLIWNILTGEKLSRVSGLEYIKILLRDAEVIEPGNTLWAMASPSSAGVNLAYLREQGINVRDEDVYLAPRYSAEISDPELLEKFRAHEYRHVIVTVGGGTQERLGLYLKKSLARVPAIHCIGAAIAFLSGDQVHIPTLVDKLGLGWLWRCLSNPSLYVPRYWAARKLFQLMVRHRDRMPPLSPPVTSQQG